MHALHSRTRRGRASLFVCGALALVVGLAAWLRSEARAPRPSKTAHASIQDVVTTSVPGVYLVRLSLHQAMLVSEIGPHESVAWVQWDDVGAIAAAHQTDLVAVCEDKGRLRLTRLFDGPGRIVETGLLEPLSCDFSPEDSRVVVSDRSGGVVVVDTLRGAVVFRMKPEDGEDPAYPMMSAAVFGADAETLFVAYRGQLRRVDLRAGESQVLGDCQPATDNLTFSPDGRLLATGSREDVAVWDTVAGRRLWCTQSVPTRLSWLPDGTKLAVCERISNRISICEAENGKPTYRGQFERLILDVVALPDGRMLCAGRDGVLGFCRLGATTEVDPLWQTPIAD